MKHTAGGFTLIELLIVVAIIGIILAMAIPGLMRARMLANEASGVSSLHALNNAQAIYASSSGGGYATVLTTLGRTCPGDSGAFLSADVTSGATVLKSGFNLTLVSSGGPPGPPDCNGTASELSYYASATPAEFGRTGNRSFATSQAGAIWQNISAVAPAQPFAGPDTPVQ